VSPPALGRFDAVLFDLDGVLTATARIRGKCWKTTFDDFLRRRAARWLGLPPGAGRFFYCRPASVGVLAYEHDSLDEPIIFKWNYLRLPRE
jgi:hypothetical protein